MSKAPAFQFYAADFLVDVKHLKSCERGVYITLLAVQWVNGGLPKDIERLARCADEPLESFKIIWPLIKHKFVEKKNLLYNPRIEASRVKKDHLTDDRSLAGEIGQATKKGRVVTEVKLPWDTETFKFAWDTWKQYKKDTYKFTFRTLLSEQMNLEKLETLAQGDESKAISYIKHSITQQYHGIFAPKEYGSKYNKDKSGYNPNDLNAFNAALKNTDK